jgi:RNA-directed DNA polymerase
MKRELIQLSAIAERKNLELAVWRAAQGMRDRSNQSPEGIYRSFTIHDPKVRQIHAACFADRVLHHAVLNLTEHVFERSLVATTFACRPSMGVHRAVMMVRQNLQRFNWYAKIDIDSYFASIEHARLMQVLSKKFKGGEFLALLSRLIASTPNCVGDEPLQPFQPFQALPAKGLPIGSLTSQHFANLYLNGADRFLTETCKVRGHVRYMDDIVWWGDSAEVLKVQLAQLSEYLNKERGLTIKPSSIQIQPSSRGVTYCGYRIRRGEVFASRRKLKRYSQNSEMHAAAFRSGLWSAAHVQRAIRGGSWNNEARNVRSANRNANHRDNRNQNLGLRLVLSFMGNISAKGHSLPHEPKCLPMLLLGLQRCVSSGELQGARCVGSARLDDLVAKARRATASIGICNA